MTARIFDGPRALLAAVGTAAGPTEWLTISQEQVNLFAQATGDDQWIHVDVERAIEGPFGAPIAHGYLTMSLCAPFLAQLVQVNNIAMGINYGVNKARFVSPVLVGSRIRARGEIAEVVEVTGGVQAVVKITIEIEGIDKPAAIVETVSRYLA